MDDGRFGAAAPRQPASGQQPAAVEPRFRGSFRPRRLEDRAYLTTATSGSIVHCHQPHSLVLSGKRATSGAWGFSHTALERKRSAHSKQRRKSYWVIQKRYGHTRQALSNDWHSKRSELRSRLDFRHCDHDCGFNATPTIKNTTLVSLHISVATISTAVLRTWINRHATVEPKTTDRKLA